MMKLDLEGVIKVIDNNYLTLINEKGNIQITDKFLDILISEGLADSLVYKNKYKKPKAKASVILWQIGNRLWEKGIRYALNNEMIQEAQDLPDYIIINEAYENTGSLITKLNDLEENFKNYAKQKYFELFRKLDSLKEILFSVENNWEIMIFRSHKLSLDYKDEDRLDYLKKTFSYHKKQSFKPYKLLEAYSILSLVEKKFLKAKCTEWLKNVNDNMSSKIEFINSEEIYMNAIYQVVIAYMGLKICGEKIDFESETYANTILKKYDKYQSTVKGFINKI